MNNGDLKNIIYNTTKNFYQLYNHDCIQLLSILKSKSIDHIITDPPYKISQKNNFNTLKIKRKGIDFGNWDKEFNYLSWIEDFSQLIKPNGSFIIFCSYLYISYIIDELNRQNFVIKDLLKWIKKNPMPRNIKRRYVQDTEFAIWAVRKNSKWIFNNKTKNYLRAEFKTSITCGKEKTNHPTQKNLSLMNRIIEIHTNKNQTILDPFMGSGTTGIACLDKKRNFIGIEKKDVYFQIAKTRFENYFNKK